MILLQKIWVKPLLLAHPAKSLQALDPAAKAPWAD
jgi:hypothetical protein